KIFMALETLDGQNQAYHDKREKYEAILAQQRKAAEAKEKAEQSKRIAAATAALIPKHDKLEKITWYKHRSSPAYVNSRTGIYLYIGKPDLGEPWLRMVVQYNADDWLFIEKYTIFTDGIAHAPTQGTFE